MTIKLLLTGGFWLLLVYALMGRRAVRLSADLLILLSGVAIAAIWMPETADAIAQLMGVERAADLIIYCWIVASMLVSFNLHMRCWRLTREMSEMARQLAIRSPIEPTSDRATARRDDAT